jgi:hAT family C-terminal dimerisation region
VLLCACVTVCLCLHDTCSATSTAAASSTMSVSEDENELDEANSSKRRRLTAAEKLLSSLQSAATKRKTIDEVILYTQEQTPDINTNPLEWWKLNGNRYPHLLTLVLKYLGIPGTSTPSERIFSKAGEIVCRRRASLKPSTVDMLVFLSKNLPALG